MMVESLSPVDRKLDQPAHTEGMLDATPFSDVVELRKEVAGKHCLHKPDRASPRQFAHAQARCETHDLVLLAQSDSGKMLPLGLSTQAKPEWPVGWKNLRLRLRHSCAGFLSIPTKKRDFFNYSLSDGIGLKLESAGGRNVALLVTARLTTERANSDVWSVAGV